MFYLFTNYISVADVKILFFYIVLTLHFILSLFFAIPSLIARNVAYRLFIIIISTVSLFYSALISPAIADHAVERNGVLNQSLPHNCYW